MSDNMDLYTAVRVLDSVDDSKLRNENVCRMTEEQIAEYSKQLDCVKGLNGGNATARKKVKHWKCWFGCFLNTPETCLKSNKTFGQAQMKLTLCAKRHLWGNIYKAET